MGEFVEAVYDVAQLPDDKVHELGLNDPPEPPSFQVTAPVGVVGELDVSFTFTTNVIGPTYVAGFGVTVVVVPWITVNDDVPKLVECELSFT